MKEQDAEHEQEKFLTSEECELVTLMSVVRGRFELTNTFIYFFDSRQADQNHNFKTFNIFYTFWVRKDIGEKENNVDHKFRFFYMFYYWVFQKNYPWPIFKNLLIGIEIVFYFFIFKLDPTLRKDRVTHKKWDFGDDCIFFQSSFLHISVPPQ